MTQGATAGVKNAVKLLVFFIAEGIVMAAGGGVLVAAHASEMWWTAWVILALFEANQLMAGVGFRCQVAVPLLP